MEEAKEKLDDDQYEASAFEALERDFQEVLQELVADKSLEHFRIEYEKLHRALKKSHDSEKRLIKKSRELNSEIVSNALKVQTALRLSQDDQTTIASLKKEIERAWKMVEASHEKEQRAKETIHNLKIEISNLSRLVEQGAGLSINQENTVTSLKQQTGDLKRTRDNLQEQVQTLTQQNVDSSEMLQNLEAEKHQMETEMQNLRDLLASKKTEAEREHRRKERLERELSELRTALEQRTAQLKTKQQTSNEIAENTEKAERQLREASTLVEKTQGKMKQLQDEFNVFKDKMKHETTEKQELQQANLAMQSVIKAKREEIKTQTAERDKMRKTYDSMKRKKMLEDEEVVDLDRQRESLKADLQTMARELDRLKGFSEKDAKQIQDLRHEHDILNKNIVKAHDKTNKQKEEVERHESGATELREEVAKQKGLLAEAMKHAHALDKQREKYGIELSQQIAKHNSGVEELKNRDNKISEGRKNLSDVRAKLAQQKTAYEAVRTDRNLYSKNLVESQDEIAEMKRKFKIMYHQIEQLKEEIKEKEQALIKEHFEHNRVQKSMQSAKDRLEKLKKKQSSLRQLKTAQESEIKKLEQTITEAEGVRQANEKEYEEVISQRDILGTQLIRRNDELALLYEKVKIQQNTLQRGEVAYKERLEEIRALKIQIANLNREMEIQNQEVNNGDERKRQVYDLQRELLQERTKVKALSEELENPMNVHRWRKLEGSDPSQKEMMGKVKALQRRFIAKTEEAVEKDLLIHEKEKLFIELQNILASQPGPEAAEQVSAMQQALKERTKQMKAMAAELNMYHSQVHDSKDELDRLLRELQQMKRRYFEQKRREQLQREAQRGGQAPEDNNRQATRD